jgi:hypothetical protein
MSSTPYTGKNSERLQRNQLLLVEDPIGLLLGFNLYER